MSAKSFLVVVICVVLLSLGLSVKAQGARDGRVVSDIDDATGESVLVKPAGAITYANHLTDLVESVATQLQATGDVVVFNAGIGGARALHSLVVGRDAAGVGRIEHWVRSEQTGSYSQAGATSWMSDVTGVAYSGGYVYILEASSRVIWRKQWNPQSSISVGSWLPWVTTGHLAALVDAGRGELDSAASVPAEVRFIENSFGHQMGQDGRFWRITDVSGPSVVMEAPSVPVCGLALGGATEAGSFVRVFGHSGDTVEVVAIGSNAVIGSGTSIGDDAFSIQVVTPLVISDDYLVRKAGDPLNASFGFSCVRRYGVGETFPDGTRILPIPSSALTYVGSEDVAAFLPLLSPDVQSGQETYAGYMAVALRSGGADPVVPIPGTGEFILDTPLLIPVVGYRSELGQGFVAGAMEIPNDPGFANAVLLLQFWLSDSGGNARVSQVMGQVIAANAPMLLSSGGGLGMSVSAPNTATQAKAGAYVPILSDNRIIRVPGAAEAMMRARAQ